MARDSNHAFIHLISVTDFKWDGENIEQVLDDLDETMGEEHLRLLDIILHAVVKKVVDLRKGDLIRIDGIDDIFSTYIFDGEKLVDMDWGVDDRPRPPSTFAFPEFPFHYWEGCFNGCSFNMNGFEGFWVSPELKDYMSRHAYLGLPYDDNNIHHNYLCTSFVHSRVTYRVVYLVESEDQREIGLDNFKKAIEICPILFVDPVEFIQDQCLIDNNNVFFLLQPETGPHLDAHPYQRLDEHGGRITVIS